MDLGASGFPLLGGRLDYVDGRTVAALTYRRRQHVVNVFEWAVPAGSEEAARAETIRGHSVVRWSREGIAYAAVSDAAAADLETLARELAAN